MLNGIQERNPHIPDAAGLLREALHRWHIEATDENSKTRRLERMEAAQGRMADEIAGLRQEIAELRRMLFEALRRPDGEAR